MTTATPQLFTAGALAKEIGVSDAKVKKAIAELTLQPVSKKGCCSYYDGEALAKLKAVLK